jgi:DNA-binding NarL/FixJ family response regulator
VAKAKAEPPDLILMDIQLPVPDGYQTTRQIKTGPKLKATPVIVVSSYAMKEDEEKARAAGCDQDVTKRRLRGDDLNCCSDCCPSEAAQRRVSTTPRCASPATTLSSFSWSGANLVQPGTEAARFTSFHLS